MDFSEINISGLQLGKVYESRRIYRNVIQNNVQNRCGTGIDISKNVREDEGCLSAILGGLLGAAVCLVNDTDPGGFQPLSPETRDKSF